MTKSDAANLPAAIESEDQLAELLSRPTPQVVDAFGAMKGDLAIIGGGGKIGPSLVGMACRARDEAGAETRITVVDRFPEQGVRDSLEKLGAETVACDLLDPQAAKSLPPAENVLYMIGMKFGTMDNPSLTWAVNGLIPAYVMPRYRDARIVAFSTGCVYSLVPLDSGGSVETDPTEPMGEYSNSCVARERIFEHCAIAGKTRLLLLRLNYAVEMRYGVLVDIASAIARSEPVDVEMGHLNCIWQGDVNAAVLRLLEHASYPPVPLNLSGAETLSVRDLAGQMAKVMGKPVTFTGSEAETALLSNSSKAREILGDPPTPIGRVVEWTGKWVAAGGKDIGKPTHFQTRDGKY